MAQNSENTRANWTDPIYRKGFIDLCLQEVNNGYRSGGTLKPCAWNRIAEGLEKLTSKRFTQKQLKNGWDYMKKQYQVWIKLISTTRHGYNAMTNTIDWPTERWEEYLKVHSPLILLLIILKYLKGSVANYIFIF